MIHDVDLTLRRLLQSEMERLPGCPVRDAEQISFDSPLVVEQAQDGEARINLYLYDVRENRDMRDEGFRRKPMNQKEQTVGVQRPPARIDLSYLVTAYAGNEPALEHRLLSFVLGVLLRFEAVPRIHLTGVLEGLGSNAVLLSTAQPDRMEDPSTLWQALGGNMRPALILVVTAPFDAYETRWTKVAREAVLSLIQGSTLQQPGRPIGLSRVQASAAGIVLDQQTEKPQPGVAVCVEGHPEVAYSDENGFFCLLNLPPGEQTLVFQKQGYRILEHRAVISPSGRMEEIEPTVIALRQMDDEEMAAEVAEQATVTRNAPPLVEQGRTYRATLTGTLRTTEGEAAAYVPVRVGRQRTATDVHGVYSFFDLPPGDHTVVAEVPGVGDVVLTPQEEDTVAPPAAGKGAESGAKKREATGTPGPPPKPKTSLTLHLPARPER